MANYRYHCSDCGKTYIGPELNSVMMCLCTPQKKMLGQRLQTPLSDELLQTISISEATQMRKTFCQRWNIPNKSHTTHGANFSKNQKLVDLIMDIVAPVTGTLRTSVRQLVISEFRYDIDSKEMIG
ncbi:hypothetical protein [Pseudomonas capsici]|uniref:hypothetical protein n=1 Tax=Pseudomonas capsici TaxID=2810614 RepID=UPI0021F0B744|nr:hypothetical protein [Pseudomonas capsici]MCV4262544.1 hypothetical protein [Pseudomonas capsici]